MRFNSLHIDGPCARNRSFRTLGEPLIEERNVVCAVTINATANLVKGHHGHVKRWLANNENRLLPFLIPSELAAVLSISNFEDVAAYQLDDGFYGLGLNAGLLVGYVVEELFDCLKTCN